MSQQDTPAVPQPKKKLHKETVLRVALERPDGSHITRATFVTAGGAEHRVRFLPRMVRQLAARFTSLGDRYAARKAGAA